jgi:hypothetical protein
MEKPHMTLNMRISIDDSHKQRYSEQEIQEEFEKYNIKIQRRLVVRKTDGAVMGEILKDDTTSIKEQLIQKYQDKHDLLLEEYNKQSSILASSDLLPLLRSQMKDVLEIIDDLKNL